MLTSLQNPLVKQIRKLHQAKGRREQQALLIEGTHLLEEAWETGYPLTTICATQNWQEKHSALWQQVTDQVDRAETVNEFVLEALATTVHPDGVIAVGPQQSSAIPQKPSLGLALETIQDPGNLGTMMRTAVAAGVEALWISKDSVDIHNPKVLRASAGAWFRVPIKVCSDLAAELQSYRDQGIQIAATLPTASLTYWDMDFRQPTIVLLGNEGAGLSASLIELADHQVQVPLQAEVESLNVSICAALLLYEVQRQRR
ncbi:MAG: TrmH family RNA methyltransferase [Microcoleaceae cyanobacterium]